MKRASLAICGLLLMGCHTSPRSRSEVVAGQADVAASAYAFARQHVLDDAAKRAKPEDEGWTIPKNSFEANVVQDNVDRSLYRIIFSGSKPGFEVQTWTVTLRRSAEDWQLVRIESSGSAPAFHDF